jgi:MoxR-like ATPase
LQRPLLVEGDAGVGKTALAVALARAQGRQLVRLQCHEGLDLAQAAYEWNYSRQLLAIRLAEHAGNAPGSPAQRMQESDLFARDYLLERPLLQAINSPEPCVLLIDEIDRADDEFEALLLEFLGEASVTIPELGTFAAQRPPVTVLTSNRSRDLHDALRRRCLYHWIAYPEPARAAAIVRRSVPGATTALIEHATQFVGRARELDLDKPPGVAETIDWVAALVTLGVGDLVDPAALAGLSALAKTPDDTVGLRDAFTDFRTTLEYEESR